tara:strand:- start:333 stop:548 length:216 start_codon:yes stop_codon:yes gene_type:complete
MTPFDKTQDSALKFAENMFNAYALLNYVPVIEQLEQESLNAVMQGDSKLMADILLVQHTLTEQVSLVSAEA